MTTEHETRITPVTLATSDVAATRSVAGVVANHCRVGDVVLLVGDLGAGKTAFAQGVGTALGIPEPVTSPTFTLVRHYAVPRSITGQDRGISVLLHADVYRLDHLQEIADLGLGELVEDGGLALVEWGDMAEPLLGQDALVVTLLPDDVHDEHRRIVLQGRGSTWAARWSALAAALEPWQAGPAVAGEVDGPAVAGEVKGTDR
jgi:tRNA threonylcarbamoyladenosine biosynthesis protein TsaE